VTPVQIIAYVLAHGFPPLGFPASHHLYTLDGGVWRLTPTGQLLLTVFPLEVAEALGDERYNMHVTMGLDIAPNNVVWCA
jgi:hypothetical protein